MVLIPWISETTLIYVILLIVAAEVIEPSGGQTRYVEEGNNITFRCVGAGYPPPLVQWRKLNGSLSDRVSITNMSMSTNEGNVTNVTVDLIFTGAYREDTGVYECSVSNLLNTETATIQLVVQCMHISLYVCTAVLHNIHREVSNDNPTQSIATYVPI